LKIADAVKSMSSHDPDQGLSNLLKEWHLQASLPPRFQERVWQRIASAEVERRAPNAWSAALGWLQKWLAQPRLAAGYLTALLVLGFVGGWVQGTEKGAELERSLSSRYVQVVDPYHGSRR
jgi:hypothetical protein